MARNLTTSSNTPTIVEVPSASGFNAGDLVYYTNGSYGNGSAATAPSTATFSLTSAQPALGGFQGSPIFSAGSAGANLSTGNSYGQYAAKLTSGNIVQVYQNPSNGLVYFQIVNSTLSAVLYGPTQVSASYSVSPNGTPIVSVAALSGGGFAVVYGSSGSGAGPIIAVFTNTGTVTTAAFIDTSLTSTYYSYSQPVQIKSMPNGGFLVSCQNASYVSVRAFDSTGTGVFAWIKFTSIASASYLNGIAVRGDSSWLVAYPSSTNNTISYAIYNATGTAIVSLTSFTATNGYATNFRSCSCACLSDGTTFVLGYGGYASTANQTAFFRFIPTGNTLGSEFYIPTTNYFPSLNGNYNGRITLESLASGNFVIVSSIQASAGVGFYALCYAVFNSSGVCLSGISSGTSSTQALPRLVNDVSLNASTVWQGYSVVETSGYFYIFYPPAMRDVVTSLGQNGIQISETTWAPVIPVTTTQSFGTTSLTTTGWTASGTTPAELAYTSAGGYFAGSTTNGTLILSPVVMSTTACVDMCSTTLANGNLLFVVVTSSTYSIVAYTYTPAGVFVRQDTLVSSGVSSGSGFNSIQVAGLTSGKFVITYQPSSNSSSANIAVFSSSYTQIGTTGNRTTYTTNTNYYAVSLCAMPNDRFVIGYQNANGQATFNVYDSSITSIFNSAGISGPVAYGITVACNPNSTIYIQYNTGSVTNYAYSWNATATNTWASFTGGSVYGATYTSYGNIRPVCDQNGYFYVPFYDTSNYSRLYAITENQSQVGSFTSSVTIGNPSYSQVACGATSQGSIAWVYRDSSNTYLKTCYSSASTTAVTLSSSIAPQTASQGAAMYITPAYGYNFALSYLNTNNYPTFAIITSYSGVDYATLTSSSPSQGVPIYPIPTTATSPAITGTVLAGVAITPASAGGTGQIQTSGFAKLNSNYPSTGTVAFDSTGQAVPGVRGTATGQNVIITGNT
jgi:hypothetical protein